ncbi:MAG: hypothetical protein OXR66_05675 [Candidatus Woesearchaeota archaeon]|nr:hypothetical protein [Candidatus Woesearchaeota archaeon]
MTEEGNGADILATLEERASGGVSGHTRHGTQRGNLALHRRRREVTPIENEQALSYILEHELGVSADQIPLEETLRRGFIGIFGAETGPFIYKLTVGDGKNDYVKRPFETTGPYIIHDPKNTIRYASPEAQDILGDPTGSAVPEFFPGYEKVSSQELLVGATMVRVHAMVSDVSRYGGYQLLSVEKIHDSPEDINLESYLATVVGIKGRVSVRPRNYSLYERRVILDSTFNLLGDLEGREVAGWKYEHRIATTNSGEPLGFEDVYEIKIRGGVNRNLLTKVDKMLSSVGARAFQEETSTDAILIFPVQNRDR